MDGENPTGKSPAGRGAATAVGLGLLLASAVGLAVGWFAEWGDSPDARWLESTGWLVVLSLVHLLLLLGVLIDGDRRTPGRIAAAGAVPLVLALCCGWAAATGNSPYPAGTRWPVVVASAGIGIVGALLLYWADRGGRPAPRRAAILLSTIAVAVALIWAPAGWWRDAVNVHSVTTDVALSEATHGPFRNEPLWTHPGRGSLAAPSGVFVPTGKGVVALDPVTGERRWSYRDAGRSSLARTVLADPSGGTVVVRDSTDLVLLDALTGEVRERLDLPAPEAVGARSLVFTPGEAHSTLQVHDHTGARRWRRNLPAGCETSRHTRDTIVVHHGRVYVAAFCPQGPRVFSFDGEDGSDQVSVPVAGERHTDCLGLTTAPDAVAVRTCPDRAPGTRQGTFNEVRLLDHRDLDLVWRVELGTWNVSASDRAIAADARGIYTTGESCEILTIDRSAGKLTGTATKPRAKGRDGCASTLSASRGTLVARVDGVVVGLG
ncbi:PQQ-binding-like beta-propeller repeat protein [Amycolatopsis cihanbeyliensis]|uniref:Outer membrane protein assembly factor BamB n=1 Tax=Amycolatopsis cihanbeyliensis TaxID=1128664 RepID=A0A542DLB8_AMYCI|nr:PQQ-binding-like beta-propeller repeat protein [Amycolatopsis cihanbeyliensis]TQJ03877.1 outer membrane protein assembly factor BamB [Amycolatopsis cihanbeyliensis]